MGKTKLNVVTAEPEQKKKKLSYEEKQALRAQKEAPAEVPKQENKKSEPEAQASISSPVKIQRQEETKTQNDAERVRGKKYIQAKEKVEEGKVYPLAEAAKLVKETSYSKFQGSVELHLVVEKNNINQQVVLPHSTGVSRKIEIASDETVKKLEAGKVDFDVLIATPQTMPSLVKFAKLLGPRGLMPNPKNGTLVDDPKKAEGNFGGNNLQIKTEKSAPLVHTVVAKTSQSEKEIEDNTNAVLRAIGPKLVKKAVLTASMGPSVEFLVK